ncbi:hypothetical protein PsorP6_012464 [Peronosclerospora sorghi]|uniref:Uncharacterized protein n=1 Tax=Peronosclerospora sorghi TaxID=230839 RepID=A0ACC0WJ96_9STRA|nr:hypothetical protein PsorP6_012464 [Peronosclerospora sorghi]
MSEAPSVSLTAWGVCIAGILSFQFLIAAKKERGAPADGVVCRGTLQLQRKLQHLGTGVMMYVALRVFGPWQCALVLFFFALLLLGVHKLRASNQALDAVFLQCFRTILRPYEVSRTALPGAYYFLLGAGFSLVLFPLRVARLAILTLSVGDPAAAFFGTLYGRHKVTTVLGPLGGNKSMEGFIGCFGVATAAAFTSLMMEQDYYFRTDSGDRTVLVAMLSLVVGASAAAAEVLDIGGWDDNLTLPLVAAVFMQCTIGHLL